MQREELLKTLMDIYKKEESIIRSIRYMKTNRPELYKEIRNHTSHLPDDTNAAELFYNLYHDIHTIQICKTPGCGKKVNLVGFFKGYSDHCCKGCTTKDPEMKRKSQESCMKKFGTKSAMQNQSVKDKGRQTTRDKYGVDHIRQSKEFKDKYEQTCLEKYGVKNPNSLQSVKDKKKQTYLEKYGVEYAFQIDEVKEKIKLHNQNLYGVSHPMQRDEIKRKFKETCQKRYGVDHAFQSDIVKQRVVAVNMKKFGVPYVTQCQEIKDKTIETNLRKYGYINTGQVPEFKEKSINTCMEKYGVKYTMQVQSVKDKVYAKTRATMLERINLFLKNTDVEFADSDYVNNMQDHKFKCLSCGNIFIQTWANVHIGKTCPICHPVLSNQVSMPEKEISDFVKSFGYEVIENTRKIISPLELDIYIPELKIAIEFDGLYWHSSACKCDQNYHINKTNLCEEKGIRLIHIFEDEWMLKREIVKNRLKQILNYKDDRKIIYARKCVIKEISPKQKSEFLQTYHIQGNDNSLIKLGAYYENELISVMTFAHSNIAKSGSRIKDDTVWELNRFCTKDDYICTGIASKLLKHFQRHYVWKEIFSYADRRWSQGNVYEKLGFKFVKNTGINYWYTKGFDRIHRYSLRKTKDEPRDKTEFELRSEQGYTRIYDCGSKKYIMINTDYKPDTQLTF